MNNRPGNRAGSAAVVDATGGQRPDAGTGTATRILDVAERLVQEVGFNAFSYADIATELQLTKPALHYHFTNKADLGAALIARYTARFRSALDALDASGMSAPQELDGYAGLYLEVLRERRMCLCGMLASEYQTLPETMRGAVLAFFDDNETWLAHVLERGRTDASLHFSGSPRDTARTIISCLEGAMLIARPYADVTRFETAATHLLDSLAPPIPSSGVARAT